jgi:hypothetical protein
MKLPYSQIDLMIALHSIKEGQISEEGAVKIGEEIAKRIPGEKKKLNKMIAEHNGISVIDLVNSPNYKVLCDEYRDDILRDLVKRLAIEFKLTDKQVWAGIALALGLLDQ